MKHYFFLDAGDFILHFLSLCGSELVKNVDDVMPSRLESLLELALRTSTANADPFKDDLGLELLSFDLTSQMVRILNFQTGDGRGTHKWFHCIAQLVTEWMNWTIELRSGGIERSEGVDGRWRQRPVDGTSLRTTVGAGGVLFRLPRALARFARVHLESHGLLPDDLPTPLLRQIRREASRTVIIHWHQNDFLNIWLIDWLVDWLIGDARVWISHKIVRNYSFPTSQWYNNAFALRHRMLHFIQNLLYYITIEVLEPSWQLFVDKIRKVDNVDQVNIIIIIIIIITCSYIIWILVLDELVE